MSPKVRPQRQGTVTVQHEFCGPKRTLVAQAGSRTAASSFIIVLERVLASDLMAGKPCSRWFR